MTHNSIHSKLYWLYFKVGDDYKLSPYRCESRQEALPHGMEYVLGRELIAVFSNDLTLTLDQMLQQAPVMPPPCSSMWRPPEG